MPLLVRCWRDVFGKRLGRGNIIRYNFIHYISTSLDGYDVHGIYLDDCLSGAHVFGNILYKIQGLGVLNGGGRDNIIENNIFARCGEARPGDSRGIKAINNTPGDSWNSLERLSRDHIDDKVDPWAKAYPLLAKIPKSWAAISDPKALWRYPEGCVFSRNIGFANEKWTAEGNSGGTFNKYKDIKDNIEDKDPLSEDESKLDLSLKKGSPALTIPGFKKIPFKEIGIRP